MVRHIVLFQFKADLSEEVKRSVREQFRADIMALPSQLDTIREIHVGFNLNPAETWDICLNSLFDTLEDVETYAAFPPHREAAGKLKPHLAARSCVDYEV